MPGNNLDSNQYKLHNDAKKPNAYFRSYNQNFNGRRYERKKSAINGNNDSEIAINYLKLYNIDMDLKMIIKDLIVFSIMLTICSIIVLYVQNFFTIILLIFVSFIIFDYLFILFYMNYKIVSIYLVSVITLSYIFCFNRLCDTIKSNIL